MKSSRELFQEYQEEEYNVDEIYRAAREEEEYEAWKREQARGIRLPIVRGTHRVKHKNRANKLPHRGFKDELPF